MKIRSILGIGLSCLALNAPAQVITSNPNLPPDVGFYTNTAAALFATYNGPGLNIVLSGITLQPLAGSANLIPAGPNEMEQFNSDLSGFMSVNGSPLAPFLLSGVEVTEAFGKTGNVTGTFNTEMLSLSLNGTTPFGPMLIRESPTLPSTGQTTITPVGGGQFQISSFFDVFTELSIDGGASWMPDTSGPSHITLQSTPEPATLAMFAIGGAALLLKLRRKD